MPENKPVSAFDVSDESGDIFALTFWKNGGMIAACHNEYAHVAVIMSDADARRLYEWLGKYLSADTPHDPQLSPDTANNAAQAHSSHG